MKRQLLFAFSILIAISIISCSDNGTGTEREPEPEPESEAEETTGALEVSTTTSGFDQDPDGYMLTVDGYEQSVGPNETVTLEELEEGSYEAELSGVADNCSVDGNNLRSVDITAAETTSTTFEISCRDTGKNRIAFHSGRDGDYEIFIMDEEGTNLTKLTDNTAHDEQPVISNDGTRIAFISKRTGSRNLFVMDTDGADVKQITSSSSIDPWSLSWSPDDSEIVFDNVDDATIYKITADGNELTQLSSTGGYSDLNPSWSADRDEIVFRSDRDGDSDIYMMNSEGKSIQNITTDTYDNYSPRWSPDGTKIVFNSDRDGDDEIFTMNREGTSVQKLTDNSTSDVRAAWSSDGKELFLSSNRYGQTDIYKIQADGSGTPVNLTSHSEPDRAPFWGLVKE